jgi:hypothetical protein
MISAVKPFAKLTQNHYASRLTDLRPWLNGFKPAGFVTDALISSKFQAGCHPAYG